MHARLMSRKPAPVLARGAIGLRRCFRPDAFGNALGQSLAYSNGQTSGAGSGTQEDRLGTFQPSGVQTQGQGPWSDVDHRNGSDIQSDDAYMQRQRETLYGLGTGSDPFRLKAAGGEGLSYAGRRATPTVPDDTRVFSDSRDPFEPVAVGQDGRPIAQVIVPPGLVGAGGIAGGGYQVVRPTGAGAPPPYDLRTDMPTGAPGYALPDIKLGAGAPPLVNGLYGLMSLAAEGFARPAQSLVDALGNLTYSLRDPANGRFVTDPNNPPSPNTFTDAQRRAAWKDLAQNPISPLSAAQRAEIQDRGWRGPQRVNEYGEVETMELSHEPIPLRDGGTSVVPRWPADHAAVDPYRQLKKRP